MNSSPRRRPTLEWPWPPSMTPLRRLLAVAAGRLPTPQTVLGGVALAWMVLLTEADAASEYPVG